MKSKIDGLVADVGFEPILCVQCWRVCAERTGQVTDGVAYHYSFTKACLCDVLENICHRGGD